MHTGRERVFPAAESLRESAELEMLFEHENATAALRQRGCGRKSTDARTDDDGVESAFIRTHARH